MRSRVGRWIAVGLLSLGACDDGADPVDGGPPPLPDAAPPPPPPTPPDLTGLYRVRAQRVGGDCPPSASSADFMLYAQSTDETVGWRAIAGERTDGGFTATGAGLDDVCGAPAETWSMTVSANGRAFAGALTQVLPGCEGAPCTLEWQARAERAGARAAMDYSQIDLDPADVAVLAAEVWRDATWLGTAARDGGRIWRMTHDAGVPFLDAEIINGFKSIDPNLAGNNFAITSMTRALDRLVVGTWDADAQTLAERGLDLPVGDGFGLWQRDLDADGGGWTPITSDGFGDATRTAASALIFHEDALYVGVRSAESGAQILRVDDPFEVVLTVPECQNVTAFVVHDGRLHAAFEGCATGARVDRQGAAGWVNLGPVGEQGLSLVSHEDTLYALASDAEGVELRRHVGGQQWVVEAASGFADPDARVAGRGLRVHDSDLLIFPAGDSAWATKGGRELRDLTRIATAEADISLAVSFERRLYLATRGDDALDPASFADAAPARLLRASSILSETGGATLRTLRDRVLDGARDADKACPRVGHWFNPALEHDQPLRVALPPNVGPEDIVRLPAIYVLHPSGLNADAAAFNTAAEQAMTSAASCLYGRPGTIPCMPNEADRDCLTRCLTERIEGADGAALVADLVGADLGIDDVVLPVIERVALVFAGYGAGVYADAPIDARWQNPVASIGAFESAIPAVAEYVERCWPLSIRGPDARMTYGFGQGGHAAASAVGAGIFPVGVAHGAQLDRDRLIAEDDAWSTALPIQTGGALAFVVAADACEARASTCSVAPVCQAQSAAGAAGQVILVESNGDWPARLPGVLRALIWMDAALRDEASAAPACDNLPDAACADVPAVCE
ncbi:MAG: hypothetical protein ACI9U2_002467 [Bradymonadia bacterium]|jgi:hypothetical protein